MDEARHQEVFRKRALAGGGLLHASPGFEWALQAIMEAPNHTMGTFLLNLLWRRPGAVDLPFPAR